jgi:microcystin-dependent protein
VNASTTDGNNTAPANNILARNVGNPYRAPSSLLAMNAANVSSVGGSQAHNNLQPLLVLNFMIALQGIFPSHN